MKIIIKPNHKVFPPTKCLASTVVIIAAIAVLSGCSKNIVKAEEVKILPANRIKPDIDYSNESPDCIVAAERIQENVVVGMTLGDVRRLVGKPRMVMFGAWWWTRDMSILGGSGKPVVRYTLMPNADDIPVTSFSFDSHGCS